MVLWKYAGYRKMTRHSTTARLKTLSDPTMFQLFCGFWVSEHFFKYNFTTKERRFGVCGYDLWMKWMSANSHCCCRYRYRCRCRYCYLGHIPQQAASRQLIPQIKIASSKCKPAFQWLIHNLFCLVALFLDYCSTWNECKGLKRILLAMHALRACNASLLLLLPSLT